MTIKTLAAATCITLAAASTAAAATFNFSFDPSTATYGHTHPTMFTGTLDINVAAGSAFTTADVSNVMIDVFDFDRLVYTVDTPVYVTGFVAADGLSAEFTDFYTKVDGDRGRFGCGLGCSGSVISYELNYSPFAIDSYYPTPAAARSALKATRPAAVVPLPAGGLLLLSGLLGVAALKRRK